MTVRLRGRLPKGRPNGLELLTDELRTHPDRSRYIVAIVAPTAVGYNAARAEVLAAGEVEG